MTYSREITDPKLGFGLEGVLAQRRPNLHGILNSIDMREWNPAADTKLPAVFDIRHLAGKKACRAELARRCGLVPGNAAPLAGMVSRLDEQKGFDILEAAIDRLMSIDLRIVILGAGAQRFREALEALEKRHPGRVRVFSGFDSDLAHLIYAGSDMFLMPSRYEPCGLGQLVAMRYGAIPVVHATGGLADTVIDLTGDPRRGAGFSFGEYTPEALVDAIMRAVSLYREPGRRRWTAAVRRAMAQDYSWETSAREYEHLYERIRNRRRGNASN